MEHKIFITAALPTVLNYNTGFAAITIGQEIAGLKTQNATLTEQNAVLTEQVGTLNTQVTILNQQVAALMNAGPGIPTTSINQYIKTGDCTALTTQPTNACTVTGVCYDTDDLVDASSNSLLGYTFTAVKSTPDATDKDGGIWLCKSGNIVDPLSVTNCTSIGGNRTDSSNTVEFTVPVGAADSRIYALTMSSLGLITGTSALTAVSVCKKASSGVLISP